MSKTLKDYCIFQEGYVNPSQKKSNYFGGDIKWLRTLDLTDKYIYDTSQHLTEEGFKSAGKSAILFPKNSIGINKSGTIIGAVSILKEPMCGNRAIINIVVHDEEILMYIYYLLKYKHKEINRKAVGSIQRNLYISALETIETTTDDRKKQIGIGSVLETIDDKIHNNNRIRSELEAMAKTIYDYWFLQYEFPNAEGKPYKSSGGKMIWNEALKRDIPADWEVCLLSDICETKLGGTPNTKNEAYWNGDIPWLSSGEVAVSPVLESEKSITELGLENSATSYAEAGSIVLSITRYIRASILGIGACFNQSVIAVIPNEIYRTSFLYPFMQSQIDRYLTLRTGAQQPHINKEVVDSTLVVCPRGSTLQNYYSLVEMLYEKQLSAAKENQELISLRDFLLPLLMNGQVGFEELKSNIAK